MRIEGEKGRGGGEEAGRGCRGGKGGEGGGKRGRTVEEKRKGKGRAEALKELAVNLPC